MTVNRTVRGLQALIGIIILLSVWPNDALDTEVCDLVKDLDPNMKMPPLEKAYQAGFLISKTDLNISSELMFGVVGSKAYAKATLLEMEFTYIGDYRRDQIIKIIKDQSGNIDCTVTDLQTAAESGDWIFGYNATLGPHPNDPAWVFHMIEFIEGYTGTETIMGIPCNRWESCKEIKMRDNSTETVGVKYYWSDPDYWTPAMGTDEIGKRYSVPVTIIETRRKDGKIVKQQFNVFRYSIPGPPDEVFQVPDGVYCSGLDTEEILIPPLPRAFSYNSEIILKDGFKTVVLYQKHYFDDELNITRMEFSPMETMVPISGEKPNNAGLMTLIHDKNTGVSYLIDKNYGTCIIGSIEKDGDVIDMLDEKIPLRMENILSYLNDPDVKYTYYNEAKDRAVPSIVFKGWKVLNMSSTEQNVIYEFRFSSVFTEVQGEDMWTSKRPIKFSTYPKDIDTAKTYTSYDINIFNFDVDRPDVLDYDITLCPLDRHTIQFKLIGLYNETVTKVFIVKFKHYVLSALIQTMGVSPLRIHNIQVKAVPADNPDNALTVVTFTLVAHPQEYKVPNFPDVSNKEAIVRLQKAFDNNRFVVAHDGAVSFLPAEKGSLKIDSLDNLILLPTLSSDVNCKDWSPNEKNIPMPPFEEAFNIGALVTDINKGSSYEAHFGIAGDRAYSKKITDGTEITLIGDYNRKQIIEITGHANERPRRCVTRSLEDAANHGEWIFGYNKTGEHGRPHPNDPAMIFLFQGLDVKYVEKTTIMDIPCNRWISCFPLGGSAIETQYYWSDPDQWSPAIGTDPRTNKPYSVPVRIIMSTNDGDKKIEEEYNIFSYIPDSPPIDSLQIPQGVYCKGLDTENTKVPKIPDYFSYKSEIIIKKTPEEYILYQKHYFDDTLNLSRIEFSPAVGTPSPHFGDTNNVEGEFVQIHDFNAGLSYMMIKNFEFCNVSMIGEGDDVQSVANNKVRMANPMTYLKLEGINFTYYQSTYVRDISASQFMGLKKAEKQGDSDTVYEYWFSSAFDELQGEGMWTTKKPLKFSMYPLQDSGNALQSVSINIYDFDVDEPDILQYDISSCTPPDQWKYVSFQLPVAYDALLMSNVQLKHQILQALVKRLDVSPLRIHNIELDATDKITTVIFTLLMKQPQEGNSASPTYDDPDSEEAITVFKSFVNGGTFTVLLPDGEIPSLTAVTGSVQMLNERPTVVPPTCPTTAPNSSPSSTGYSGGSLAGLGIGMLLLGILLGGGGAYLYVFGLRRPS